MREGVRKREREREREKEKLKVKELKFFSIDFPPKVKPTIAPVKLETLNDNDDMRKKESSILFNINPLCSKFELFFIKLEV